MGLIPPPPVASTACTDSSVLPRWFGMPLPSYTQVLYVSGPLMDFCSFPFVWLSTHTPELITEALGYVLISSSVGYPSLSFFSRVFLAVSVLPMEVLEFWNWGYTGLNMNKELAYKPVFLHYLWCLFLALL